MKRGRRASPLTLVVVLVRLCVVAGVDAHVGASLHADRKETQQKNQQQVRKKENGMFLYNGSGAATFSVCTCAKCGSSTLMQALLYMVSGMKPRDLPIGSSRLHEYDRWGLSNVIKSETPGTVHFIVTRDPVSRYISAFHSKVKCCLDSTTKPCYDDTKDLFGAPSLHTCTDFALPSEGVPRCYSFADYVGALTRCHSKGLRARLNSHFRPQDTVCPLYHGVPTLSVTVDEVGSIFRALRGYNLREPTPGLFDKSHNYSDSTKAAYTRSPGLVSQLRNLSALEYAAFGHWS